MTYDIKEVTMVDDFDTYAADSYRIYHPDAENHPAARAAQDSTAATPRTQP